MVTHHKKVNSFISYLHVEVEKGSVFSTSRPRVTQAGILIHKNAIRIDL
jgi:hypothetical protein